MNLGRRTVNLFSSSFLWMTIALVLFTGTLAQAQTIGFRFTPNIISAPKVNNPSPGSVFGEKRVSFDAGIDYSHMLNKTWGISAGVDMGVVDWNYYLIAPLNAFGTGTGEGMMETNSNSENYMYNAVSAQVLYSFRFGQNSFHAYAGPGVRYYHQEKEHSIAGAAINRGINYDPYDPDAGPPDLLIDIPPAGDRFHLNISIGLGIEKRLSNQSSMVFGIRKNWGLQPIGKGTLFIQMYDQFYNGSFSPRSNYWGIDLKFNYSLEKGPKLDKAGNDQSRLGKYRQALFAEALGSGLLISGNFDTRLNKGRNDGLGLRTGLGLGGFYSRPDVKDVSKYNRYVTIPLMVNHILGRKRNGLETGLGFTSQIALTRVADGGRSFIPYGTFNMGYRLQPVMDGLIVRATWTPLFDAEGFYPRWAGLSIGYSFK